MKRFLILPVLALLLGSASAFAVSPDEARAAAALALTAPPAPPKAAEKAAGKGPCVCGDDCKCGPGVCPSCPTAKAAGPRDALVRVRSGDGAGSGTVVWSDGTRSVVLTAAHVVGRGETSVRGGGKWHRATVLASDTRADLAAVLVGAPLPAVPVSARDPGAGAAVEMLGCSSLWSRSKIESARPGEYHLAADPNRDYSDSGDSGGGVFVGGALVGVHCGRFGASEHSSHTPYCASAAAVREFMARVVKDGTVVAPAPAPVATTTAAGPSVPAACANGSCAAPAAFARPVYGQPVYGGFAAGGCSGGSCGVPASGYGFRRR